METSGTDLLVGFGEVGQALHSVLAERRKFVICDPPKKLNPQTFQTDWLHVCIPYTNSFVDDVLDYREKFFPRFIVIHSTVPVGTTSRIVRSLEQPEAKDSITFSPVRGIHPHLGSRCR